MSDLHTRILTRCDPAWYGLRDNPPRAFAALRAAVELHAPRPCSDPEECRNPEHMVCRWCRTTAPCTEIKTIARELGVSE